MATQSFQMNRMSLELITVAWNTPCSDPIEKLVLVCLADFANTDALCWPAVETIARRCDLADRSVRRVLRRLEDKSLVKRTCSKGKFSNRYTLTISQGKSMEPGPIVRDNPDPPSGQPGLMVRATLTDGQPNRNEPPLNPHNNHQEERVEIKQLPEKLNTARMNNKWQVWQTARRGLKKPKSWFLLFNEQIEWLTQFDEPTAFEILSASIRNGWQGLFPPKNYGSNNQNGRKSFDRNKGTFNEGAAEEYDSATLRAKGIIQ